MEQHFDDPELEGIVAHKTGCARTEGYYKISKLRKRLVRRHEESSGRTIISDEDLTAIRHMQLASKDERATYRRLLTSIGADSILLRVNQLKYRKKVCSTNRQLNQHTIRLIYSDDQIRSESYSRLGTVRAGEHTAGGDDNRICGRSSEANCC